MIEYCVLCKHCNSPILLGSVEGSDSQLTLTKVSITCQSCDSSVIYEGKASVFSRTGKYAYWGVICECGAFQPILRASLDHRERVPDVPQLTILCRHRVASPSQRYFQQFFDKSDLKKMEFEEEIQNFQPYPFPQ